MASSRVQVVGVTVAAARPISVQHVRLERGLEAIYGKNGVGKTRLLGEVHRLLTEEFEEPRDRSRYEPEPSDDPFRAAPVAFYGTGGLHLRAPVTEDDLAVAWDEHNDPFIRSVVGWFTGGEVWQREFIEFVGDNFEDAEPQEVHPPLPTVATQLGMSEANIRSLLESGHWFFSPSTRSLYLCDPDPYGRSSIAEHWVGAQGFWAKHLAHDGRGLRFENDVGDYETDFLKLKIYYEQVPGSTAWYFDQMELVGNGGDDVPQLMPLPETLQLAPGPDWVAYPFLWVNVAPRWIPSVFTDGFGSTGALQPRPTGTLQSAAIQLTLDRLPHVVDRRAVRRNEAERKRRLEMGLKGGFVPKPLVHFDDLLEQTAARANGLLAELFEDPPVLRCHRFSEEDWLDGRPPLAWEANTDPGGAWFPIEQLGAGHARYVQFAIQRALEQNPNVSQSWRRNLGLLDPPTIEASIALIDEPEVALHSVAEQRVAGAIEELADTVLVSTHSTEFLDAAIRSTGSVQHITREADGSVRIECASLPSDSSLRRAGSEQWGISPARLAAMTRLFVFVEGPHDEVVVNAVLENEIRRCGAVVMPMMGTRNINWIAESSFIFASSDAPILICVDNVDEQLLSDVRSELRKRRDRRQRFGYLSDAERDPRFRGVAEAAALLGLIRAAVSFDRLDRVHTFGFSKRDIAEYLPVELIHPKYSTWEDLDAAFLRDQGRDHFVPGDGQQKKAWVKKSGGRYDVPGIKAAMVSDRMSQVDRHADFERLGSRMMELSRRG